MAQTLNEVKSLEQLFIRKLMKFDISFLFFIFLPLFHHSVTKLLKRKMLKSKVLYNNYCVKFVNVVFAFMTFKTFETNYNSCSRF